MLEGSYPPPSPYWLLASGAIGAAGAILAQLLAQLLTRSRERRRFQVETFERFRREFGEKEELRRISKKHNLAAPDDPLTDAEIETYVDFFEGLGFYVSRGEIDVTMVDEILGDYVLDAYQNSAIMRYIGAVRGEERDPSYWEHFERLGKELLSRKAKRRKQ